MKINEIEIKKIKKQLPFYNFKKFRAFNDGICLQISPQYNIVRYADIEYGADSSRYEIIQNNIIEIIKKVLKEYVYDDLLLIQHNHKWLLSDKKTPILSQYFKENGIPNSYRGGIIEKDLDIIQEFVKASLMGETLISYIELKRKIIFIPSDHMDVFLFGENSIKLKKILRIILMNYPEFQMVKVEKIHK